MSEITPVGIGTAVGLGTVVGLGILHPDAPLFQYAIVFAFYGFWAWALTFTWQGLYQLWRPPST